MARSAGSRASHPRVATERLQELPSVEELSARLEGVPHDAAVRAARAVIAAAREALLAGAEPPADLTAEALALARLEARPSLRPLLNATGVIVHTNLGRAPLHPEAAASAARAGEGYSNLEYDLESGARG